MRENYDEEAESYKALKRHKRIATGLLGVMGTMTIVEYSVTVYGLVENDLWMQVLKAGTKAGFIGGLADWFAVTALFRHPLGLPLPHTAILPAQKNRLGVGLGRFIANQLFTEEEVSRTLKEIDLPRVLSRILASPTAIDAVSRAVASAMPNMLDRFEDGRAGSLFSRILPRLLSGESAASIVAKALHALVDGDHHQEVLTFLLMQAKTFIKNKEGALRQMIEERVREQGGRFLGWMIGSSIATKVLVAAAEEVDRIDPADSDLRNSFSAWIRNEIIRIEKDSERGKEIGDAILSVISHESVKGWGNDIWGRIRHLITEDVENSEGWVNHLIKDMMLHISSQLDTDQGLQEKIVNNAHKLILGTLPYCREWLIIFVGDVVKNWDAKRASRKIELRIGKDLQFVRINGTIVGFLAGLLISLLLHLCFGGGVS
ncbi:DUF445 domain-containing protein [Entomobacter blattae]|uniref:DUF445 domain-containing protein n=1 Tax=Entomobacter blattae TaxID=2762277 RepID=A0A7H1NSV0_9PROT|nr:DUF445 domain-containing protein [Entomobacter blattae]QNT78860.1 hypothetical protein JGUZn3_16390 [Entomobacter blattae]